MRKKWSLAVGILIIIILVATIVIIKNQDSRNSSNEKNNILSEDGHTVVITSGEQVSIKDTTMEVGEFTIENLNIEYKDGSTYIKGDILNSTEKAYLEGASFKISLYEKERLLVSFPVVSNTLEVGGRSSFNTQLTMDCSMATDIVVDFIEVQ